MEGEFEKRIKESYALTTRKRVILCPHDTIGECDCAAQWVLKIIDKAKAEIPKDILLVLQNIAYASKQRKEKMILRLSSEDCGCLSKWFLKWFGKHNGESHG